MKSREEDYALRWGPCQTTGYEHEDAVRMVPFQDVLISTILREAIIELQEKKGHHE